MRTQPPHPLTGLEPPAESSAGTFARGYAQHATKRYGAWVSALAHGSEGQ